jgi:hypothetical protein
MKLINPKPSASDLGAKLQRLRCPAGLSEHSSGRKGF